MTKIIDNNGSLRTVIYTEVTSVDINVNVNASLEGTVSSALDVDINVTDSLGAVTPDSVSIVGNTITIDVPDAPAAAVGATLMKTGQTTSYRTGDDGDLEAGRATDFFTLASNNPFGNTNRFTDELGGSTYANGILIDWSTFDGSTVLGYGTSRSASNWNDAVDNALLTSLGTYTTGWRLPNIYEMMNLRNHEIAYNYSPFNISNTVGSLFLTSNSLDANTCWRVTCSITATNLISSVAKTTTTSNYYIPCRTFTVSGTTLS